MEIESIKIVIIFEKYSGVKLKSNPIEEICNDLGVNQKKLAELMGVTQNSISNWKKDINKMPSWTYKMFNLLRVEKNYKELTKTLDKLNILK